MARATSWLREPRWFGTERANAYAKIMLAGYAIGLYSTWLRVSGAWRDEGGLVRLDFSAFWTAAALTLRKGAATAYDLQAQISFERSHLGLTEHFMPFYYPPPFLAVVTPFGALPYAWAFVLFAVTSYALYVLTARPLLPRGVWPIAAFPGAYVNLMNGQSAGLVSAIYVGALQLLDRRPVVAGLLIGLLAIKPQFAILVPVALAASGRWRAFAAAAVSAASFALLSALMVGAAGLRAFAAIYAQLTPMVLADVTNIVWKMQSAYAVARTLGAPDSAAMAAQAVVSCAATVVVWRTWARPGDLLGKGAVLIICSLLTTPYVFDYDWVMLIMPICWLAGEGLRTRFRPWEVAVLALAYLAPFSRPLERVLHFQPGPLALLLLLWAVLQRLAPSPDADAQARVDAPPGPSTKSA